MKYRQVSGLCIVFFLICSLPVVDSVQSGMIAQDSIADSSSSGLIDLIEYRAVIVAIEDYPINRLPYSEDQMQGFLMTLENGGNWKQENIHTISDSRLDPFPDRLSVQNEIQWLADEADDNDVSLFYFIGHGGRNLTNEYIKLVEERIWDVELADWIGNISGRLILVFDSCYSGGFIEETEGENRVVVTASEKDKSTWQIGKLESGLFGYFFNVSFSWFSKNVEHAYLFTKVFTYYYGKKISEGLSDPIAISPQISDGTMGPTRLIRRHDYIHKMDDLLQVLMDVRDGLDIWRMT